MSLDDPAVVARTQAAFDALVAAKGFGDAPAPAPAPPSPEAVPAPPPQAAPIAEAKRRRGPGDRSGAVANRTALLVHNPKPRRARGAG